MSEEIKKERTLADIQQEYVNLSVKAGGIQYQIYVFEKDLELLNESMKSLNFEHAALTKKEAEAKKAE